MSGSFDLPSLPKEGMNNKSKWEIITKQHEVPLLYTAIVMCECQCF